MSTLILIPCSKAKAMGGRSPWSPESSIATELDDHGAGLMGARRELGAALGEPEGPDLGGGGRGPSLLPAVDRYRGRLYRAAGFSSWDEVDRVSLGACVVVVSGLYGLLHPFEPIRKYDCWMERTMPSGQSVARWWYEMGLAAWFHQLVTARNPSRVVHYLPRSYANAIEINALALPVEVKHPADEADMRKLVRQAEE